MPLTTPDLLDEKDATSGRPRRFRGGCARNTLAMLLGAVVFGTVAVVAFGAAREAVAVEVTVVKRSSGLPSDWVTALAGGEDGIWVGTGDAGVALLDPSGRVMKRFGVREGLPADKIQSLAVTGGKVYAGTRDGIGVFDGSAWGAVREAGGIPLRNVYLGAEPDRGRLWACAVDLPGGLFRYDGRAWEFLGGDGRGLVNRVRAFAFDNGVAWLGTTNSGVYRWTDADVAYYRGKDGLPSSSVYSMETFMGAVFAGTAAGAARRADGRWTAISAEGSKPLTAVFAMAASPSSLYLGGGEGLYRYRSGRVERFSPEDGVPAVGRVNAVLWRDGVLFAGTSAGLFIVRGW